MRRFAIIFAVLIMILIFIPITDAQEVRDPGKVNKLLSDFDTPQIIPGNSGTFKFTLNNPYGENMTSIHLNISVYKYATIDTSADVVDIKNPPIIQQSMKQEYPRSVHNLSSNDKCNITFTIYTRKDTPHGSYFSQSTYFVRFWLEFNYSGEEYTMFSRGYFTDEQWDSLTSDEDGIGGVNQTYMRELGCDGIIPDSSFGVKIPIPMWPFYLLVSLTIFFAFLACMFYLEENPGQYPWLEKRFQRLQGKMNQFLRLSKHGLDKTIKSGNKRK